MVGTFVVSLTVGAAVAVTMMAIRTRRLALAGARLAEAEVSRLRSELERSQNLLGQADRLSAIGMLAASVAHEVRNPLVSVRTFVQLVPERFQDAEFRTSFRALALGEIDRICLLMNDLLAFARPSEPETHATDINDVISQIQRLLEGEAKKRFVEVSAEVDPSLPLVSVDEARVKQVFLNTVLNAIQACEAGGSVKMATRAVRRAATTYFQVEIHDSGCGIAPRDVERIFDPFFTTKEDGCGLGLFIARRIMHEHGGLIEVASAPDGTIFYLNFPLPDAPSIRSANECAASENADHRPHRSVAHS